MIAASSILVSQQEWVELLWLGYDVIRRRFGAGCAPGREVVPHRSLAADLLAPGTRKPVWDAFGNHVFVER
jgi:hypothetical protein